MAQMHVCEYCGEVFYEKDMVWVNGVGWCCCDCAPNN